MLEEPQVFLGIEGSHRGVLRLLCRLPFREDDVVLVGQPLAGFYERLAKTVHHKVDDTAVGIAYKALEGVLRNAEVKAWVGVVVKRAQASVTAHSQT